MPRKEIKVDGHQVEPDAVYGSRLMAKFINHVMLDGKRSTAESIVYKAMDRAHRKSGEEDVLALFKRAVDNIRPVLEVKSRRVGGSNYQVPVEVRPSRSMALAMRWIIGYAGERPEKSMRERLANEILDASAARGGAFKKKDDTHRMAEANKAFAHYRW